MKNNLTKKMWNKAKKLIVNGNMLLSKNPTMHAPNLWPSHYSKAKDCYIWDLDNNKYLDFSFMGIGTNILGYSNPKIDNYVKKIINKSVSSTLNCPEEVVLAEKLIKLHPWSNSVKFTRTGGEAATVALRIARSYAKNKNIAFCGYHGWHDWYLSSNLNKKDTLKTHHIPNLSTIGVSKNLRNEVYSFNYNNINGLKNLINSKKIGVVIMEVKRNIEPKKNFLQSVRKITKKHGIILIFDECTSGFRQTYGGLHLFYKVNPDLAIFGKSLGNGYAINAIIGKKKIMNSAKKSFISSTFWTERIGPTAAIKTLDEMKKKRSWNYISKMGKAMKKNWANIAKKNNIKINISGMDAIPSFTFESDNQILKTFLTQEFLKNKILASNVIYFSTAHKKQHIKKYLVILEKIFKKISILKKKNKISKKILKSQIAFNHLQRIN